MRCHCCGGRKNAPSGVVAALLLSVVNSGMVAFAFHAKHVSHQSRQGSPLKPALYERREKRHFKKSDGVLCLVWEAECVPDLPPASALGESTC